MRLVAWFENIRVFLWDFMQYLKHQNQIFFHVFKTLQNYSSTKLKQDKLHFPLKSPRPKVLLFEKFSIVSRWLLFPKGNSADLSQPFVSRGTKTRRRPPKTLKEQKIIAILKWNEIKYTGVFFPYQISLQIKVNSFSVFSFQHLFRVLWWRGKGYLFRFVRNSFSFPSVLSRWLTSLRS